jgi:hypothetical protein
MSLEYPQYQAMGSEGPRPERRQSAVCLLLCWVAISLAFGCAKKAAIGDSEEKPDAVARMPQGTEQDWIAGKGNGYIAELLRLAATTKNPVAKRAFVGELVRACEGNVAAVGKFVSGNSLETLVAHLPGSGFWLEASHPRVEEMRRVGAYVLILIGEDVSLRHAADYYATQLRHDEFILDDFMRHPTGVRYGGTIPVEVSRDFHSPVSAHSAFWVSGKGAVYLRMDGRRAMLVEVGLNAVPALLELLADADVLVRLQARALLLRIAGICVEVKAMRPADAEHIDQLRREFIAVGKYPL